MPSSEETKNLAREKEIKKEQEQVRERLKEEVEVTREEKEKKIEEEKKREEERKKIIEAEEEVPPIAPPVPSAPPVIPVKTKTYQEIENILAGGLEGVYSNLDELTRREFKIKGEETASKIEKLLQSATVKVKTILDLIKNWLKIIPGINKFFLEQEAKIKTDKILKLRKGK